MNQLLNNPVFIESQKKQADASFIEGLRRNQT